MARRRPRFVHQRQATRPRNRSVRDASQRQLPAVSLDRHCRLDPREASSTLLTYQRDRTLDRLDAEDFQPLNASKQSALYTNLVQGNFISPVNAVGSPLAEAVVQFSEVANEALEELLGSGGLEAYMAHAESIRANMSAEDLAYVQGLAQQLVQSIFEDHEESGDVTKH